MFKFLNAERNGYFNWTRKYWCEYVCVAWVECAAHVLWMWRQRSVAAKRHLSTNYDRWTVDVNETLFGELLNVIVINVKWTKMQQKNQFGNRMLYLCSAIAGRNSSFERSRKHKTSFLYDLANKDFGRISNGIFFFTRLTYLNQSNLHTFIWFIKF